MDRLEASLASVLGTGPAAPVAIALIDMLAGKAMTGVFGNLGGLLGGGQQMAPAPYRQPHAEPQGGTGLLGGLGGLQHVFQQSGHGTLTESWVGGGPNHPVSSPQLQQAIGADILHQLAQKTGLSEADVVQRLAQELPGTVDRLTPQGRLPSHEEASALLRDRPF